MAVETIETGAQGRARKKPEGADPHEVAQPLTAEQKQENAQFLREHPLLAQTIAEKIPAMVEEKFASIIGQELFDVVRMAKSDVDRSKVGLGAPSGQRGAGRPKMDAEQGAEWLRVAIAHLAGHGEVKPNADLDADGLITQSLTPISGSGAYLLPEEFVPEIERKEAEVQNVWPLVTKRPTKVRKVVKPEYTDYPSSNRGANANVNSATTATEITETVPTWEDMEWDIEDFDMRFPVKLDLLEESPVSVYEELIWCAGDAFAVDHEELIFQGSGHGSKLPLGLLHTDAGITTVAINAAPTVANILETLLASVPQKYRARAAMLMPSSTFFKVASVFAQNINAPQFLTQIGALPPMKESGYIDEGKIVVGDFSKYVVYYIKLMQIITSIEAQRKCREIVVTERWTGRPTIADAFRIGTGVTYT